MRSSPDGTPRPVRSASPAGRRRSRRSIPDLWRRPSVEVRADGWVVHRGPIELLVVGTTPFYGRGLKINPGARPDAGRLSLRIYPGPAPRLALEAARWAIGVRPQAPRIDATEVTVHALDGDAIPMQADGDLISSAADWRFTLAAGGGPPDRPLELEPPNGVERGECGSAESLRPGSVDPQLRHRQRDRAGDGDPDPAAACASWGSSESWMTASPTGGPEAPPASRMPPTKRAAPSRAAWRRGSPAGRPRYPPPSSQASSRPSSPRRASAAEARSSSSIP